MIMHKSRKKHYDYDIIVMDYDYKIMIIIDPNPDPDIHTMVKSEDLAGKSIIKSYQQCNSHFYATIMCSNTRIISATLLAVCALDTKKEINKIWV